MTRKGFSEGSSEIEAAAEQDTGQTVMHRSPRPPSHPHLADTAGVIEAVTDGVVVLFPAGALGRQ